MKLYFEKSLLKFYKEIQWNQLYLEKPILKFFGNFDKIEFPYNFITKFSGTNFGQQKS